MKVEWFYNVKYKSKDNGQNFSFISEANSKSNLSAIWYAPIRVSKEVLQIPKSKTIMTKNLLHLFDW
jgi:hypothetical protein